jgi:hypothetical protein
LLVRSRRRVDQFEIATVAAASARAQQASRNSGSVSSHSSRAPWL